MAPVSSALLKPSQSLIPSFIDLKLLNEPVLPPGSRPLGPAALLVTKKGQLVYRVQQQRGRFAQWLGFKTKDTFFRFDRNSGTVTRRWVWKRNLYSEGQTRQVLNVVLRRQVKAQLSLSRQTILNVHGENSGNTSLIDHLNFQEELADRVKEIDQRMARQIEVHVKQIPLHTEPYQNFIRHIDAKLADIHQGAVRYADTKQISNFYEALLQEWNADGNPQWSPSVSRYDSMDGEFGQWSALPPTVAKGSGDSSSPSPTVASRATQLRRAAESIRDLAMDNRGLSVLRWIGLTSLASLRPRFFGGGARQSAATTNQAVVRTPVSIRKRKASRIPIRQRSAAASRATGARLKSEESEATIKGAKKKKLRLKKHASRALDKARQSVKGVQKPEQTAKPQRVFTEQPPETSV